MLEQIFIPTMIIGSISFILGIILAFSAKKLHVKVDKKLEQVINVLPGTNCGACGEAGCESFAKLVLDEKVPLNGCRAGGEEVSKNIANILGVENISHENKVARVLCGGDYEKSINKFEYSGIDNCQAAANLYGGPLACVYGCVGMGNCEKICPVGAIYIEKGLAKVNVEKCIGCQLCVKECPKNLIKMFPVDSQHFVICSSNESGKTVMGNCSVGCIGCKKCVKACEFDAINFENRLASIDVAKCTNCGECVKACPTNAIIGGLSRNEGLINV